MWAGVGPRVEKGKKPGDYGRRRTGAAGAHGTGPRYLAPRSWYRPT